ncbi:glycosyltransferase family 4 protein [Acinetobacter ursingii]|uniref:glycosyltransferase family 4 protein n=1 Tax=Acinetobacter ursingii TaxID=108980 RepID=UPI0032B322E5
MEKKIVFLMPSLKTGGGNRVTIELSNHLIKLGYKVDIVYPNNSLDSNTFAIAEGINFIKIGDYSNSKKKKIINLLKCYQYINKIYHNESIIVSDPIMSIFAFLAKSKNIYRYIQVDDYRIFDDLYLLKNLFILHSYKFLTRFSYKLKIGYIFNSLDSYEKYIEVSKRKDVPFKTVHPAIDHKVFFDKHVRSHEKVNLCIVARKHPWKGFKDFIEAYNEGKINGLSNVYVISHDDLSEFDLTKVNLVSPKNDDEIAYCMNISHLFLSTSWMEGFGLPPLEAMACGCACLISKSGGVNEYAVSDVNCIMYEPKDISEMVTKLNSLISNFSLQQRLRKKGNMTVKNFEWQTSTQQLLNILND